MKGFARACVGAALAAAAGCSLAMNPRPAPPLKLWAKPAIESFLRTSVVASVDKDSESGRTLPWRVKLEKNGLRAEGVFKYIRRARPHPMAADYRYELAAYELSQMVDKDIVPPTIERVIDGVRGSLMYYVPGCLSERDRERTGLAPPDLQAFLNQMDDILVFEVLTGASCQAKDDILIHKDTWTICRIDFAEAFVTTPGIAVNCQMRRISRHLFGHLQKLTRPRLADRLRPYLGPEEITAVWERARLMAARFKDLIKEKNEAAVLF